MIGVGKERMWWLLLSSVKDRVVVYRLLRDGVCAVPRAELQRRIRAIAIKYVEKTIIIKRSRLEIYSEIAESPDRRTHICYVQ